MKFTVARLTERGPVPLVFKREHVWQKVFVYKVRHGDVELVIDNRYVEHLNPKNGEIQLSPLELMTFAGDTNERGRMAYVLMPALDITPGRPGSLAVVDMASTHEQSAGQIEFAVYGNAQVLTRAHGSHGEQYPVVLCETPNRAAVCWTRYITNGAPISYQLSLDEGVWTHNTSASSAGMLV